MTGFQWLQVERHEPGIVVIRMNKPPVNALGRELVAELTSVVESLKKDDAVRCVIFGSAGKHFCGGADLKERRTMSQQEATEFVPKLAGACHAIADLPMPTIAAVRGAAAGGGCELALACDLRILADDTKIGLRETALAIIPGAGGTQRLPRLIGPAKAKRWIFTAQWHTAEQAQADGVADGVVPVADLEECTMSVAATIALNGPQAVRLAKRAIEEGADRPIAVALSIEWDNYQETLTSEDRLEALEAFAAKRPPVFQGR